VAGRRTGLGALAPEQACDALGLELLEGAARLLQQLVLPATGGKRLEFVVHDAQVSLMRLESCSGLLDLRA
jgi:hypothetical protein